MGFLDWLFGKKRESTPRLPHPKALARLDDDPLHWAYWGNFSSGFGCPYCGSPTAPSGLIMVAGNPDPAPDLWIRMPHMHTPKTAKCPQCQKRYEWRWVPPGQGQDGLNFEWRPGPPPAPAIPENASTEERADWELWLQACKENTAEAYSAYLRDTRLRLFASEANTMLRWKKPAGEPK
jgi:hypothetical protein